MMKRSFSLTASLLTLFCMLSARVAGAASPMAGTVTDGTRNAPAVGAAVQLLRPNGNAQAWTLVKAAKSDAAGRFSFGTLPLAADDLLLARVTWQGYDYEVPAYDGAGRLKQFDPNLKIKPAQLAVQVFDSTAEPPPLTAIVHHIAIETKDRDLKCIERIVLENPTRRTYLGGADGVTAQFAIPPGAREVALDPEIKNATLTRTGNTVAIAMPITPAAYNNRNAIIFNYLMSWPLSLPWHRSINLSRKLRYPTRFFFVARTEPDRALKVVAPQLGADIDAPLPIDGNMQSRIVNSIGGPMVPTPSLEAGTQVAIGIQRATNPLVWAFVMFVVALCVMVPLAVLRVGRGSASKSTSRADKITEPAWGASVNGASPSYAEGSQQAMSAFSPVQLSEQARDLIDKIAHLDDEWQNGDIGTEAYHKQRALWKERLMVMLSAPR